MDNEKQINHDKEKDKNIPQPQKEESADKNIPKLIEKYFFQFTTIIFLVVFSYVILLLNDNIIIKSNISLIYITLQTSAIIFSAKIIFKSLYGLYWCIKKTNNVTQQDTTLTQPAQQPTQPTPEEKSQPSLTKQLLPSVIVILFIYYTFDNIMSAFQKISTTHVDSIVLVHDICLPLFILATFLFFWKKFNNIDSRLQRINVLHAISLLSG